jgi:uncharacterized protein YecE (DUF72 family)
LKAAEGREHGSAGLSVGTSGFAYDHWDGVFYPERLAANRRLEFYARHFSTVELNVTFYRTPPATTFSRWRDSVPDDFRFAVKASRYLTHVRRLKAPREPVEFLMERVRRLGDRLGPILLQLPPDMPIELDRLDRTLSAFGNGTPVSVEPRHASWFVDELRDVLTRHGAALCLADRSGPRTPLWRTAPWLYLRLHEGRAMPPSCYGMDALGSWVARLVDTFGPRPEGYVYFNNDGHACAPRNASTFERLLARRLADQPGPR